MVYGNVACGSLKWTGHALAPDAPLADFYDIVPGKPSLPSKSVSIEKTADAIIVSTGIIQCQLPCKGERLIETVKREDTIILCDGHLTGLRQDSPDRGTEVEVFDSLIDTVFVEQSGSVRAVIKITGTHRTEAGRNWLPFTVRLYCHAGSDGIRMAHTFVFDGDEYQDFISGLGIRFSVPMRDACYNRHVRFASHNGGLWGEAVQGVTGLRRDPGESYFVCVADVVAGFFEFEWIGGDRFVPLCTVGDGAHSGLPEILAGEY